MTDKEIKQEIRQLKKLKLQCRAGTKERVALYRQIRELKNKLIKVDVIITEDTLIKEKLILEVLEIEAKQKITPRFADLGIDLHKYTVKELEIHLAKLNKE